MEHWEFLLQKNGDRSWLPLDSPSVEILEGRYRIVVRSSQPNTEIEIRISHLNPEADPPKRRLQKRSGRTNQDGLMVLIPFTRLEPGVWEFYCGGDLMSELVSAPWQYSVQLQVLPQDVEVEEWEPDWSESSESGGASELHASIAAEVIATPLAEAEAQVHPVQSSHLLQASDPAPVLQPKSFSEALSAQPFQSWDSSQSDSSQSAIAATHPYPDPTAEELRYLTEQLSDELIDEVMQEFDLLDLPEPFQRSNSASELNTPTQQPSSARSVSLKFEQDSFVARQSETLVLNGTIQGNLPDQSSSMIPDPWDSTGGLPQPEPPARSLQLYLRDPQSLEVLASDRRPLPIAASAFNLSFNLPDSLTTRLILGEVQLCSHNEGSHDEVNELQVLATQTFTITVNPIDLVQELTRLNTAFNETALNEAPLEATEPPQAMPAPRTLSLDLSFLTPTEPDLSPTVPLKTPSLGGQPLPPQIYHPDSSHRNPGLHLPDFSSPLPPESPLAESDPAAADLATTIGEDPPALEIEANSALETEANPTLVAEIDSANPLSDALTSSGGAAERPVEKTAEPVSSEAIPVENLAFRALNLHDRFLTRLNALVGEESSDAETAGSTLVWSSPASLSEASERMADEVVNDESSARTRFRGQPSQTPATETDGEPVNPLVLLRDEPVPTPDLQVTSGELVAGQPVNIRVRLPNLLPRIYIKLWINDRQTRSLLEGPRWLVDLLPNGHGALETTTQLIVPLGSLDIRFEAIAVEMQTQRESRKVSVDRAVIPPNLPTLSLYDLDD